MRRVGEIRLPLAAAALLAAALLFGVSLARALAPPAPVPADTAGLDLPAEPARQADSPSGAPATEPAVSPAAAPALEPPPDAVPAANTSAPNRQAPDRTRPGAAGLALQQPTGAAGTAGTPLEALELAADQDPFQPDRSRAPAYRLGPAEAPPPPPPPTPPPPPNFNVVGLAVSPRGGLAMIQVEGAQPVLVNTGESLMGYRLVSVDGERAVLQGSVHRLELAVMPPVAPPQGRGNAGRGGNNQGGGQAQQAVPVVPGARVLVGPDGAAINIQGRGGANALDLQGIMRATFGATAPELEQLRLQAEETLRQTIEQLQQQAGQRGQQGQAGQPGQQNQGGRGRGNQGRGG
jgi:hypothetical protein